MKAKLLFKRFPVTSTELNDGNSPVAFIKNIYNVFKTAEFGLRESREVFDTMVKTGEAIVEASANVYLDGLRDRFHIEIINEDKREVRTW